jgi:hypothetical protein
MDDRGYHAPMRVAFLLLAFGAAVGCGDNDPSALSLYYPFVPKPTGDPQSTAAGEVTSAAQLVTGPAATGMVGDFYLQNDRVRFIVSAPTRVIGVIPQGGNVVDAALLGPGGQTNEDHFGELAMIYKLGRTCDHQRIEVIRDGEGGGVAALRAIGVSGNDDFLNLKGAGLPVDDAVNPDYDDGLLCATTYVLPPDSTTLQVYHSLYNPTDELIKGPLGTIADTGGKTEAWGNRRGFERAGIEALTSSETNPLDFVVYQAPGVSYGVIPRHSAPATAEAAPVVNTSILIAGVSIFLLGADQLIDIIDRRLDFLALDPRTGVLRTYDLVVATDASVVADLYNTTKARKQRDISGVVQWSVGGPAKGARVGVFEDGNSDGQLDNNPDGKADAVVTYFDVAADGTFAGKVPDQGNLLVRAEVKDVGRSPAVAAAPQVTMAVPSPLQIDYDVVDNANGAPIPARLLVVGQHPAQPDPRLFETFDRIAGVVQSLHTVGDASDPVLELPAGGTYRIFASRGTEWSVADAKVTGQPSGPVRFALSHVAPATGYYATEWHVHQVGSPDSPVLSDERLRSAASSGVEMFAITDHDYVSDLQPLVREMGLEQTIRAIPGIEVTPFSYGHFNAWPIEPDDSSPNRGAVDWAAGAMGGGFAMTPREIFDGMRDRGAKLVQVNHPRSTGFGQFQAFFDRANLLYDYARRTAFGDFARARVSNELLRLPEESLWDDSFNTLEVWNGFGASDTDADGVIELTSLDRVLRDWFNMLSLGMFVTPAGNSDTHTSISDPMGMPRTYVRVANDSGAALDTDAAVADVLATLTGASTSGPVPRDLILTDGPMLRVSVVGQLDSAIGRVVSAPTGAIALTVSVTSPEWADFDTIEVFANETPDSPVTGSTALTPLGCWTTRAGLLAADPCRKAAMPAQPLTVIRETTPPGPRLTATAVLNIDADDINPPKPGKTGKDAWLVVRVRGDRGIFPLMSNGLFAADPALFNTVLNGTAAEIRAALAKKGAPAQAFTAPIFVDFDGGGYRAPYAP